MVRKQLDATDHLCAVCVQYRQFDRDGMVVVLGECKFFLFLFFFSLLRRVSQFAEGRPRYVV